MFYLCTTKCHRRKWTSGSCYLLTTRSVRFRSSTVFFFFSHSTLKIKEQCFQNTGVRNKNWLTSFCRWCKTMQWTNTWLSDPAETDRCVTEPAGWCWTLGKERVSSSSDISQRRIWHFDRSSDQTTRHTNSRCQSRMKKIKQKHKQPGTWQHFAIINSFLCVCAAAAGHKKVLHWYKMS